MRCPCPDSPPRRRVGALPPKLVRFSAGAAHPPIGLSQPILQLQLPTSPRISAPSTLRPCRTHPPLPIRRCPSADIAAPACDMRTLAAPRRCTLLVDVALPLYAAPDLARAPSFDLAQPHPSPSQCPGAHPLTTLPCLSAANDPPTLRHRRTSSIGGIPPYPPPPPRPPFEIPPPIRHDHASANAGQPSRQRRSTPTASGAHCIRRLWVTATPRVEAARSPIMSFRHAGRDRRSPRTHTSRWASST